MHATAPTLAAGSLWAGRLSPVVQWHGSLRCGGEQGWLGWCLALGAAAAWAQPHAFGGGVGGLSPTVATCPPGRGGAQMESSPRGGPVSVVHRGGCAQAGEACSRWPSCGSRPEAGTVMSSPRVPSVGVPGDAGAPALRRWRPTRCRGVAASGPSRGGAVGLSPVERCRCFAAGGLALLPGAQRHGSLCCDGGRGGAWSLAVAAVWAEPHESGHLGVGVAGPSGRRRCPVPHRRVVVAGPGPRPQTSRRVAGHGHRHRIAIWLPRRCATPRRSAQPAVPPIAERRDGARCDTTREADKNAARRASRPLERDPLDEPPADCRESTRKWFRTDSRRAAAEALQAGVASPAGEPLKHFSIESDRCLRSARRHGRKYAASEFTIEFQAPKSLFRASFGHLEPDRGVYGQVPAERRGENGAKCRDRLFESICRLGDRRRPRPVK